MKKLILALALLCPTGAWAQCTGVFPANTLCGNLSASPQPPAAFTAAGTIVGQTPTTSGALATWGNNTGTLLGNGPRAVIVSNYTFSGNLAFTGLITSNLTLSNIGLAFGMTGNPQQASTNVWTGTSGNDAGGGGTNTWLGPGAGPQTAGLYTSASTLGTENIAIGFIPLISLTTGVADTAIGGGAGTQITTGSRNTVVGRHAQRNNHAGSDTVAIGEFANNGNDGAPAFGIFNFTGHVDNGAGGNGTLLTVTAISGTPLLVGMHINGGSLTSGGCEIISLGTGTGGLGTYNLDCTANTGSVALTANLVDASQSTLVGGNAGYYVADPNPSLLCGGGGCAQATAVGFNAYQNGFTGTLNVAVGYNAMQGTTGITGGSNVAVGASSCSGITSGSNNVCIGGSSGTGITAGTNNTVVGSLAGNPITGSNNTAIGMEIGSSITSGSSNTLIGPGGNFGAPGITTGSNNLILGGAVSLATSMGNVIILSDGAGNIRADYGKTSINPSAWAFAGGVSCAAGTVSIATFVVTNGLVTHC